MNVRFFDPGKSYKTIESEIDTEIKRVLTNGDLILREDVEKFEKNFASYAGTRYAVALNSGTDALYLSLWALGIKAGDKVLVPSHTFVATAQVVAQLGAEPVLYDMDGAIQLDEDIKAVMVAHIAGEFGAHMQFLIEQATRRAIPVIEDACQALGAEQDGKKAGSFGITGCFSFYPAKILGCYGDGGALVTDDEEIYKTVIELRNHWKSDYSRWGINSRLDNLQAAVLNVRLKHLPHMLEKRKLIAEYYLQELEGVIGLPKNSEGRVWQDFIVRTPDRDNLQDYLRSQGIETMKNEYPMPIQKLPIAAKYESETLRIPCNDVTTQEEAEYVVSKIKHYVNSK